MENKMAIMKNKNLIYLILGLVSIVIITALIINAMIERPIVPPAPDITPPAPEGEPQKIMKWNNPPEIIIDKNANYIAVLSTRALAKSKELSFFLAPPDGVVGEEEDLSSSPTNKGDIEIELFVRENPITVNNFIFLAQQRFYEGIIFHRVIDGFMIQAGCPYGTGRGGPGYTIPDEFRLENRNDRGTISMANAGPNTGGSQFFINLVDNNFLDARHPAFGRVIKGMDIVDAIGRAETGPNDRPLEDIVIKTIEIIK